MIGTKQRRRQRRKKAVKNMFSSLNGAKRQTFNNAK